MSDTYTLIYIHIVFSLLYRQASIEHAWEINCTGTSQALFKRMVIK